MIDISNDDLFFIWLREYADKKDLCADTVINIMEKPWHYNAVFLDWKAAL